jgi:NADH-quinone oxidoreductase subunit H
MSLIYYLVFPGFIFVTVLSLIISWFDRKLTARIQWRVGPPFLQNFYDLFKLFSKEVLIPDTANKTLFVLSPIIALASIILVATILWLVVFMPNYSFVGDVIVVLYLLMIPSIMFIIGASSSGNPIAVLGASREIKLMLSYELPLICAVLVSIIKSSSIKFVELMKFSAFSSVSEIIALIVAIICFQAKLGLVPFDIAEAETEIASGIFIEYSGPLLGMIRLTRQILFSIVAPLFIITVFLFKGSWLLLIIKYILLIIIFTLIRNVNPRLRIDQAVKFFWFIVFPLSLISTILALLGL